MESVRHSLRCRYKKIKYNLVLKRLKIKKEDLLILATITKTGTHYLRFLFANYLKQLDSGSNKPVGSMKMRGLFNT